MKALDISCFKSKVYAMYSFTLYCLTIPPWPKIVCSRSKECTLHCRTNRYCIPVPVSCDIMCTLDVSSATNCSCCYLMPQLSVRNPGTVLSALDKHMSESLRVLDGVLFKHVAIKLNRIQTQSSFTVHQVGAG